MVLANTYSRRLRATQSESDDVYQYDTVHDKLRTQIMGITIDLCGDGSLYGTMYSLYSLRSDSIWAALCQLVAKENGIQYLQDWRMSGYSFRQNLEKYIQKDANLLEVLDFCDLLFIHARNLKGDMNETNKTSYQQKIEQAIEELNAYFKESSLGYEYNKTEIIRIDSQHIHKEIIKPVLQLLRDERFQKVDEEYRLAHQHYRNKLVKDCVVSCNRAFESMLKTVCELESWEYQSTARASDLIKFVRKENLFLDTEAKTFDCFVATLKNGVPALRNEYGGHGEGNDQPEQPLYMAQYLLNLTASNLMFLYQAWEKYVQAKP